ncbi:MAG TPA: membrane protein insertion efficiency factor YidD [Verrucomicrobiaceae bacterium]
MKKEASTENANAPRRVLYCFRLLPSAFCIFLVRLYRLTVSPFIAFLAGPSGACRFEPSCSQYAIEALKTHGAVTGTWLAAKRICRCHPGAQCGNDPVPPVESKVQGPKSKVPDFKLRVPRSIAVREDFRVHHHGS